MKAVSGRVLLSEVEAEVWSLHRQYPWVEPPRPLRDEFGTYGPIGPPGMPYLDSQGDPPTVTEADAVKAVAIVRKELLRSRAGR